MASRAMTEDIFKDIYQYNRSHHHWHATGDWHSTSEDDWGGGRVRRLVCAVALISFWCLLRGEEALRLQFHNIIVVSPTCVEITIPWRKQSQNGGSLH